jgi:dTDP-4-amino-4,6-dideoxygalactose transaminase
VDPSDIDDGWREPAYDQQGRAAALRAVEEVLDSGPANEVPRFEEQFAAELGFKHVVAVNSGGAALHLALSAAGVRPGDEVIVSAHGPVAPAAAAVLAGAKVVFADVQASGLCIDPADVARRIGANTKAVIASHVHGELADLPALARICEENGAALIEDATEGIGAVLNGHGAGSMGRIGCFGFGSGAGLTSPAGGGAVVTAEAEIADRLALLSNYGRVGEHYHLEPGFDYAMSRLQAAMLLAQLPALSQRIAARQVAAGVYASELANSPIELPGAGVYQRYVIRTRYREALREYLSEDAIPAEVPYPTPLHLQPSFLGTAAVGELPRAEAASRDLLALPLYPGIPMERLMMVVRSVRQFGKFSLAMAREAATA